MNERGIDANTTDDRNGAAAVVDDSPKVGFFFETIMGMVEYVYLDAFIAYCALVLPDKISYVVNFVLDLLPFKFGDDDDDIEEEVKVDAEDTLVEDLMGFLAAYGVNTANVYMTPIFTYFFLDYNDQLRLLKFYSEHVQYADVHLHRVDHHEE